MKTDLYATPQELLDMARAMLDEGKWPRAAALLARQALEQALREFWMLRAPGMEECSRRAQLDCLLPFVGDNELGSRISAAWAQLTHAVHHRAYEDEASGHELYAAELATCSEAISRFVRTLSMW